MGMDPFRTVIIVVSDTAARGSSVDKSGPLLRDSLEAASDGKIRVVAHNIVPDDPDTITAAVQAGCDDLRANLVITSGGTGFSPRDNTPEAVAPLIHKHAPALAQAITAHSLSKTPLAALSRGIAGIRTTPAGSSLVICLPGSPKAVKECVELLLNEDAPILLHALRLVADKDESQTHRIMQGALGRDESKDSGGIMALSGGCSCCSKHSPAADGKDKARATYVTSDLDAGPSARKRQSPYPMISLDAALDMINRHTRQVTETHQASIDSGLTGGILAEDIHAETDLPPSATSNVDGYAVSTEVIKTGIYPLRKGAPVGAAVSRVNTGQPLPNNTDAVVMVEDTEVVTVDGQDESEIKILRSPRHGDHVRRAGSDLKRGQLALRKGTVISALGGELGTCAFVGAKHIKVYRRPIVAILSTGNELVDLHAQRSDIASHHVVVDSNRPGLKAAIEGQGFEVVDLGIVGDDRSKTVDKLREGAQRADIVISTGGTSMGESDLLKSVLERDLHATIHFGRVAMKPGKPTAYATTTNCSFFALPGNPASALVCFYIFVVPALRKMANHPPTLHPKLYGQESDGFETNPWSMPRVRVRVVQPVKLDPRPEFHRVCIRVDAHGELQASSTGQQRSSGMHSMATANGLLCLPALREGEDAVIPAGQQLDAILLGAIL